MQLHTHHYTRLLSCLLLTAGSFICGAQTRFMPGKAIAVTKTGDNDALANFTIYTANDPANPSVFQAGPSVSNGRDLNGFGLNARDSFLYGAAYTGDTLLASTLLNVNLYRLNAAGTLQNLGKLPTSGQSNAISTLGGIRAEIPNYTAGVIDSNRYYYVTVGLNPSGITKLANAWVSYQYGGTLHPNPGLVLADIRLYLCWINNIHALNGSNMPAAVAGYRRLTFNNIYSSGAVQMMLDNLNATFPQSLGHMKGGMQDFARHPLDGSFYSFITFSSGSGIAGRPVKFVPNTGNPDIWAVIPQGTVHNVVPQEEISGLNFTTTGQLYALFNNGQHFLVQLGSGALMTPSQSNLPLSSGKLWGDMAGIATGNNVGLPLDLTGFSGRPESGGNLLEWTVSPESRGNRFVLERSTDSRNFQVLEQLLFVQGRTQYRYTDVRPAASNYYRLRLDDEEGSVRYSNVVAIAGGANTADIRMYPTLVADGLLHLTVPCSEFAVKIYNTEGKVLFGQSVRQNGNGYVLHLPALAAGSYLIHIKGITDAAIEKTLKFMVP